MNGKRPHPEGISERSLNLFKIVDPLRVRLLVNSIERGDALRLEILRHALIGREHELLDQAVRDVALRARDALHQAELVKFDHRLGRVEVDRSTRLALSVEG